MLVSAALMDYTPTEQSYILKAVEEDKLPDTDRLHTGVMKVMEVFDSYDPVVEGYAGFDVDRETVAKKKKEHPDDRNVGRVVTSGGDSMLITGRKSDGRYIVVGKKGEKTAKDAADLGVTAKESVIGTDIDDLHHLMLEGLKQARKNVGASTCWKGYKASGTKKKGGKVVPNCVKEEHKVKCPECKGEGCNHCDDKGFHMKEYFVSSMREYFEKDSSGKMVKKHNCAKKVKYKKEEYDVVHGEHTLLEDGTVTHYDIISEHGTIIHNVPVEELEVTVEGMHEHFVNDAKNAEVLGEKKLDPVGKADADIDKDGDVDKSDKFLHARRKKVTKIIAAKNRSSKK